METRVYVINFQRELEAQLAEPAKLLREGHTVAFPTETVYGLGANGLSGPAVEQIYSAKGRPGDNPLILHIANREQLMPLVSHIPPVAEKLMDAFWPGPLTLVFPKSQLVPEQVTAGLTTVAVRMPDHPVALSLIAAAGVPVAAPSANRSGKPSPTEASHVLEDLSGKITAVVAGGNAQVGLESTVLDVTPSRPMLLRPGSITREMLEQVVGQVDIDPTLQGQALGGQALGDQAQPKAPGMKYAHYAPEGQVYLVDGSSMEAVAAKMLSLAQEGKEGQQQVALLVSKELLAVDSRLAQVADQLFILGTREDLPGIGQQIYSALRQCDSLGMELIIAEAYPRAGYGMALMNRLDKAASYQILQV